MCTRGALRRQPSQEHPHGHCSPPYRPCERTDGMGSYSDHAPARETRRLPPPSSLLHPYKYPPPLHRRRQPGSDGENPQLSSLLPPADAHQLRRLPPPLPLRSAAIPAAETSSPAFPASRNTGARCLCPVVTAVLPPLGIVFSDDSRYDCRPAPPPSSLQVS